MKNEVLIIWSSAYLLLVIFTFFTESSVMFLKSFYIYSLIATFPLGISVVSIIQSINDSLTLGSTGKFLAIFITYYVIGYIQWFWITKGFLILFNMVKKK